MLDLWLEPIDFIAWRRRVTQEHAMRNLTHARRLALEALLRMWRPNDTFEPTDDEIALQAGCSARTVRRARADAREIGLLHWERTRLLVAGRWRQGRNRYALAVPTTPVSPGGQRGRARQVRKKSSVSAIAVSAARAALNRIESQMLSRFAARWDATRPNFGAQK